MSTRSSFSVKAVKCIYLFWAAALERRKAGSQRDVISLKYHSDCTHEKWQKQLCNKWKRGLLSHFHTQKRSLWCDCENVRMSDCRFGKVKKLFSQRMLVLKHLSGFSPSVSSNSDAEFTPDFPRCYISETLFLPQWMQSNFLWTGMPYNTYFISKPSKALLHSFSK